MIAPNIAGGFFPEMKDNKDYLESNRIMGAQKSSSHPIIWRLQQTVVFTCPSKENLIVPSKIK